MQDLTSVIEAFKLVIGGDSLFGGSHFQSSLTPFWFRGQSNADWKLESGVHRKNSAGQYLYDEYNMLKEMRLISPEQSQKYSTTIEWLVLNQHYGLPTRLLDWTESILVALYFAVQNDNVDGRLVALDPFGLNARTTLKRTSSICLPSFPDAILRADQSICASYEELRDRLNHAFSSGDYYAKYLDSLGEERIREVTTLPIAVYPPRSNPRITSQSGMFTLHGGTVPSVSHRGDIGDPVSLEELDEAGTKILTSLRVPAAVKRQMRRDLARLGVHQASLFPEFEYQARYIREKWTRNITPSRRVVDPDSAHSAKYE